MTAYYNEAEPYAASWLRNLAATGLIPAGDVDERSIADVYPDDLAGYTQCHFFAGLGGWAYACRLAGWPDDRPIWTGSCPCQPFSVAGRQKGQKDERHLWPEFKRLIAACRPNVVMGEQVAAAVGKNWLDEVYSDLGSIGYTCRAAVVPACAVDAPHRRDRLWFVADTSNEGERWRRICGPGKSDEKAAQQPPDKLAGPRSSFCGDVAAADSAGLHASAHPGIRGCEESAGSRHVDIAGFSGDVAYAEHRRCEGWDAPRRCGAITVVPSNGSAWGTAAWLTCADGKARRVEPSICLLAHGIPARVGKLRALGNAIVPQVAAEIILAYMETCSVD